MKKATSRKNPANRSIPTIIAVGSSLVALPAGALELGELTVQSQLGQPLRASIAYALAPNEQLSDYCVTMRSGPSVSGLPGVGATTVRVANGVIMLMGKTPVREPMISAHVVVNCRYSANLSREYTLFIDPSISTQPVTATPQAEPIAVTPAAIERPVTSVRAEPVQKDIGAATSYQVQSGESLSRIAQRIENRSIGLWPAVNAIFAANPDAFMNNDPNQLKAGSWLFIPDFNGSSAVVAAPEPVTDPVTEGSAAYEPTPVVGTAHRELVLEESALIEEPIAIEDPLADKTSDLQPGDIILNTELEGPTTASSSPNVPTAIISTRNVSADGTASPSWLIWLAGSGIALILGLLMFGRRLRDRSGTAPAAPLTDEMHRRFSDTQTTDTENIEALGVDLDISDDLPTEENLILDADLVIGTGLEHGATSGDSEDFGFAAATELDIELPFESVAQISDETGILPPLRTDEHSILESEVLPEDDDYDMSVIVDATKMPWPDDVTERDLKAVEPPPDDEMLITDNCAISEEVDYKVIEQDYEDELTATQVVNKEIARAATELAVRMKNNSDDSETTAPPLATVTELDITAQMLAQNDEISDLGDTDLNEAITVNTAADDETVEMPVESGKAS